MTHLQGWFKSSHSGANNVNCVEVRFDTEAVLVRDSKNPDHAVLHFDRAAWAAFLSGVTAGEFGSS